MQARVEDNPSRTANDGPASQDHPQLAVHQNKKSLAVSKTKGALIALEKVPKGGGWNVPKSKSGAMPEDANGQPKSSTADKKRVGKGAKI